MLAVGSAAVFPFEMDTVVSLANNRLVGTHYGFYNTIVGIGILAGNLATGALMQAARIAGREELIWLALTALGFAAAAALYRLDRTGHLVPESPTLQRTSLDRGQHGAYHLTARPVDCRTALLKRLSTVLRCSKPPRQNVFRANIVLRGANLAAPVLVDFGLSFNDEAEDDLTRVGDEIGNRFLRLPEHTLGIRTTASDVTQLAGIFVYLLTGIEPRMLDDDAGRKPHRREPVHAVLAALFKNRQLLRLQSVFDKAFNNNALGRYQFAPDLIADLKLPSPTARTLMTIWRLSSHAWMK